MQSLSQKTWRSSIKKLPSSGQESQRIVKLEVVTTGCTKTLRLSEKVKKLNDINSEDHSNSDEKSSLLSLKAKARKESMLESVDQTLVVTEQP